MAKKESKITVKKFTRQDPCNKSHIWNCFRARSGFRIVAKDEARAIIGDNAPRVMLKNERIVEVEHKGKACFKLTKAGEAWAKKGIASFIRNHPDRAAEVKNLPKSMLTEASA